MRTDRYTLQNLLIWPSELTGEPPIGADLATPRDRYTHHGIYVGDGRVIHYAGFARSWHAGPVEEVNLIEFASGHPLRIVDHPHPRYLAQEIVQRARSRLGERDYRLLSNNCEHFCNWCISGQHRSEQVERFLRLASRGDRVVGGSYAEKARLTRASVAASERSSTRSFPRSPISLR